MRDKVCIRVRLAATQRSYELRVPHDLPVGVAADLMARLLEVHVGPRFRACDHPRLMLAEGPDSGSIVDGQTKVGDLVATGVIAQGTRVVLT